MNSAVTFFAILLIGGNMLGWALEGEQPFTTTTLAAAVTAAATLIPVDSVSGYRDADYIFIDGETIQYSSVATGAGNCSGAAACFNVAAGGRGVRDSDAAAHASGTRVYSRALGPINQAAAMTIKEIGVFDLKMKVPWINPIAMVNFVTKSITWDFIFFDGAFETIRIVLSAMSIGFVFFMFVRLAPVFVDIGNMIRNFFRV